MKLAIISHTEHYRMAGDKIVGWGPTVREINHLLTIFDEIWHVAVLNNGYAPMSAIPYESGRVHFIPIQPFGGKSLIEKMRVLCLAPNILQKINRVLKKIDYWQFRAPAGIGNYLIPYLSWFVKKPGWFKYAGNWGQNDAPLGYSFQRFWLIYMQRYYVTINGKWTSQKNHCLTFENPCLDLEERRIGSDIVKNKDYDSFLNLCFVGTLNIGKGVDLILEALEKISENKIASFHFIGDGPLREKCDEFSQKTSFPIICHGFVSREKIAKIILNCHFIILPSKSEGFPKVIAEGANYGCIPVVSNVSAIGQYIQHGKNGFLLDPKRLVQNKLSEDMEEYFKYPQLKKIALSAYKMAESFTFERYSKKLCDVILN